MEKDAQQGLDFITNLKKFSERDDVRGAVTSVKIGAENGKLLQLTAMNPKSQVIVISAVAVRKAMHASGLVTKDETVRCLAAVAKLASTLAVGAVAAPATFGLSAYIALASAAVDGYDIGSSCFNHDGAVSHTVEIGLQ